MTEQIGEAVINVRTDGSKAVSELGKIGDQGGARMSAGLGRAAKAAAGLAAGAFATAGVTEFFKSAVSGASDLEEGLSKTNVVFGKGAKAVVDYASQGAEALGQTKNQALEAAGTFGVFGKAAGLSGNDLAKFSTDFTSLATDLASFHNASPEEAITAIGAALRGESEPIRRFGVLLDDASLRAEAMRQGLIKTTSEALTPQQKTLAASALIMKQTTDAQGDFQRTSDGLANSQRILSASLSDMATKAGTALLPAVTSVVQGLQGLVTGFQEGTGAGGQLREAFDALMGAVQGVWGVLQPMLAFVVENIAFFGPFAATILAVVGAVRAWATAQMLLNAAMAMNPLGLVVVAIAALVGILVLAYQRSETFRTIVQGAFQAVVGAAQALWTGIQAAFSAVAAAIGVLIGWVQRLPGNFGQMVGSVIGWVAGLPGRVAGFFASMAGTVSSHVSGLVSDVVGFFAALPGRILGALGDLAGRIWSTMSSLSSKVSGLVGDIVGFFAGLPGKIVSALGDIAGTVSAKFSGIVDTVRSIPGEIVGLFTGLAGKILNAIGSIDIGSLIRLPDPGGGVPYVPGVATGTRDFPGGLAVVGEEGPELVSLPRHSQVTPADDTLRWFREMTSALRPGGGGETHFHAHLPTGDPEAAAMAMMNRWAAAGARRG